MSVQQQLREAASVIDASLTGPATPHASSWAVIARWLNDEAARYDDAIMDGYDGDPGYSLDLAQAFLRDD